MTITLDGRISADLAAYCSMAGKDPQKAVMEILSQGLSRYRAETGRVEVRKAFYRKSEKSPAPENPCYILGSTTIYGRPYLRILDKDGILNVPKELVEPVPRN